MRNPKLLPLALLDSCESEAVEGITRLQKLVFLAQQEIDGLETEPYTFEAYDYGPFSTELYDDLDELVAGGYVDREVVRTSDGNEKEIYEVGEEGRRFLRELQATEDGSDGLPMESLRTLKDEYNEMPLLQLLKIVYDKYPEYATESVLDI
jgi:uncharacterized protein YwgA